MVICQTRLGAIDGMGNMRTADWLVGMWARLLWLYLVVRFLSELANEPGVWK